MPEAAVAALEREQHRAEESAKRLARRASSGGVTVAVAESLTCGLIASTLGATDGASQWFRGGVVAYSSEVKFDVLGVARGPVVTRAAAETMAERVAELCSADLGIAVTGVGGPSHEEHLPPGTVFIAVARAGRTLSRQLALPGDTERVINGSIARALELAVESLGAT